MVKYLFHYAAILSYGHNYNKINLMKLYNILYKIIN